VLSDENTNNSLEEVNQEENFNLDVELGAKAEDKSLHVVFQATDGSLRFYKLSEIPFYEDAFAMTVHKSQGSGFNHVMLIMPDKEVAILTRELIYTGITRTKNKLVILGKENIIRKSLVQKTFRYSGLYQRYNDKIQQKVGV
jgi:exodeoxyribonuclease V alpha subunit